MNSNSFFSFPAIACLMFAAVCCRPAGSGPEQAARAFLDAYLAMDYAKAASYCTPAFSEKLLDAVEDLDRLDSDTKQQIVNSTRTLIPEIGSVEKLSGSDTVIVSYSIHRTAPDSTLLQSGVVQSVLSLIREEDNWKIAALNKL